MFTGLKCPGCGITTMLVSLLSLEPSGAFHANVFLFCTSPLLIAELIYSYILSKKHRRLPIWNSCLLLAYTAALCAFGVLRNTVFFGGSGFIPGIKSGLIAKFIQQIMSL